MLGAASFALTGCSDFEDINRSPYAVDALTTKPYYALNKSIIQAQQNPDTAERLFVINWAAAARQDGEDGYGISTGYYNDGYNGAAYGCITSALKYCYDVFNIAAEQYEFGQLSEHERAFFPNVEAFTRIWRTYLMSEFADSFGPMPIDGFQGVNPEFASVREVYYYLYKELAEAVAAIDTTVEPTAEEAKSDVPFGFDPVKWKKFGISLWMRFAMRLSEADNAKAREEFEKAIAAGQGITTADETFRIPEYDGWDDWTGVMSRYWDIQALSATMANLTTNLGGTNVLDAIAGASDILKDQSAERYQPYVKDASTRLGVKFERHFLGNSDNPTKQILFDGLPEKLDPRMLLYFLFPGDYANRVQTGYDPYFGHANALQTEYMMDQNGDKIEGTDFNATFAWNGLPAGIWYDETAEFNGVVNGGDGFGYPGTYPALSDEYRNSTNFRVFFGPWETYFLLAEASLYGWNTGTTAEAAYNNGIKASFEYTGFGAHYNSYINSENYNRVGTSVKFSHTAEPTATQMTVKDGYTGRESTVTYNYPNAANILYKGKKLNDQLTKIITQKYIANTPWLPLENWSDHRRLGLPFWEIPTSSTTLPYMPEWSQTSYQGAQKPGYFFQRMKYPSSLNNADPTGYQQAVDLLGGTETTVTPLWWAIGGTK